MIEKHLCNSDAMVKYFMFIHFLNILQLSMKSDMYLSFLCDFIFLETKQLF